MPTLNNLALALQGFGAGVGGRGPEFLAGQKKLSDERRQALLIDNRNALGLLDQGKNELAAQLLRDRIEKINQIGGDPSDTQEQLVRIEAGDIAGAIDQGRLLDDAAIQRGFLKAPPIPKIVSTQGGIAVIQDQQTGEITTQKIVGLPTTSTKDVQRSVQLPGGLVQIVYEDGTTEVIEPTEKNRALIEAAEERGVSLAESKKRAQALGTVEGRETEARVQKQIQSGIDAAQGVPILRRSLQLLERIETGGIDAARLRAKQLFGVEGADEGELSANLGRAVLSQLKATFGSQFTEREGARLERMSAGFGKSPPTNKRILRQSLKIATDAMKRGLAAAQKRDDESAAAEILDFLEGKFDLTDEALVEIFVPRGAPPALAAPPSKDPSQQAPITGTVPDSAIDFSTMTDEQLRAIIEGK